VSEIAMKYAALFAHSIPGDDTFGGEVRFIAQEIDTAAREIAKPLVEAVEDYLSWSAGGGDSSVDGGLLLSKLRTAVSKLKGDK
jgi:hypothetical protein